MKVCSPCVEDPDMHSSTFICFIILIADPLLSSIHTFTIGRSSSQKNFWALKAFIAPSCLG